MSFTQNYRIKLIVRPKGKLSTEKHLQFIFLVYLSLYNDNTDMIGIV